MVEVVEFRKEHMKILLDEPQNHVLRDTISEASMLATEKSGLAYTVLCKETNKVLCCGGISEYWRNRGEAWIIFHHDVKKQFLNIYRCTKRYLEMAPVNRIEAAIMIGFEQGHRWIKSLGFELEAPLLRKYLPDGQDCSLYVRIK